MTPRSLSSPDEDTSALAKVKITVDGYKCERCGHEWIPRPGGSDYPKNCPACKSPYWDKPRMKK